MERRSTRAWNVLVVRTDRIGQKKIRQLLTVAIEVHDLLNGEYQLTVRANGGDRVTIDTPFPVTVTPADLIRR